MVCSMLRNERKKVPSLTIGFCQECKFERSFQCFRWCNTLLSNINLSIYYYYYACVYRGSSKTPFETLKEGSK
jgi:hypothetical protein